MTLTPNRSNIKLYINQNLSTVESEGNTSVRYYPNPVKNVVTISGNQHITSLDLYNLAG